MFNFAALIAKLLRDVETTGGSSQCL